MKLHRTLKSVAALICLGVAFSSPIAHAESADALLLAAVPTIQPDKQMAEGRSAYASGAYDQAYRIFRNIAVLGDPEAHFMLGVMCRDGQGTRKSAKQAEYWFKQAARQNHPKAADALRSLDTTTQRG